MYSHRLIHDCLVKVTESSRCIVPFIGGLGGRLLWIAPLVVQLTRKMSIKPAARVLVQKIRVALVTKGADASCKPSAGRNNDKDDFKIFPDHGYLGGDWATSLAFFALR